MSEPFESVVHLGPTTDWTHRRLTVSAIARLIAEEDPDLEECIRILSSAPRSDRSSHQLARMLADLDPRQLSKIRRDWYEKISWECPAVDPSAHEATLTSLGIELPHNRLADLCTWSIILDLCEEGLASGDLALASEASVVEEGFLSAHARDCLGGLAKELRRAPAELPQQLGYVLASALREPEGDTVGPSPSAGLRRH